MQPKLAKTSIWSGAALTLIAVSVYTVVAPRARAQGAGDPAHAAGGCVETESSFPLALPGEKEEDARGRIELRFDGTATVTVRELRDPTDDGAYTAAVSVSDTAGSRDFGVASLIKGGGALRLVRAREACGQGGHPLLVLGLTAGWTDAVQGFILVRRVDSEVRVDGLPLAEQGRLVLRRGRAWNMELWSATSPGQCDACPKPYAVQDCTMGESGLECRMRHRLTAPMNPGAITANIIEMR